MCVGSIVAPIAISLLMDYIYAIKDIAFQRLVMKNLSFMILNPVKMNLNSALRDITEENHVNHMHTLSLVAENAFCVFTVKSLGVEI